MLEAILQSVRRRLPELIAQPDRWVDAATSAPPARDLAAALGGPGLAVIAEVKRRSPSAGAIALDLDPITLARSYADGGAAAISVLTDGEHFGGSLDDLRVVAESVGLPVLRKDFILHPVQLVEARAARADAVLLIVAALDDALLESLIAEAGRLGMTALVEAHDEVEVVRAAAAGADVIGVNNRDLRTFEVDPGTAERLRHLIPTGVIAVAESGISDAWVAGRMAAAGYDAVLVGEAATRAPDPAAFVASLQGSP